MPIFFNSVEFFQSLRSLALFINEIDLSINLCPKNIELLKAEIKGKKTVLVVGLDMVADTVPPVILIWKQLYAFCEVKYEDFQEPFDDAFGTGFGLM